MAAKYGNSSINMLVGAERIRRKPASMLGSAGLAGARHGFTEIYGNALDEKSAGFGTKLDICYHSDGSISVRDYGRGVPLGWNDNEEVQNWNWHVIYNELYGGGKYDNGQWYLSSIDRNSEWIMNEAPTEDKAEGNTEVKAESKEDEVVVPTMLSARINSLRTALLRECNIDILELPKNDKWQTFDDIDIMRTAQGNFILHVNNASWATATWEFLNKRLNYLASVGLNGLGAASTQYTSEFFQVKSYRNGKVTSRSFKQGVPLVNGKKFDMFNATKEQIKAIKEEVEKTTEENGTYVRWKPDKTVFSDVNVGSSWLYETCKDIADVANIELHFIDENKGIDEVIPAGNMTTLTQKHCGEDNIKTYEEGAEPVIFNTSNFVHGLMKVEGAEFTYVARCDISFCAVTNKVANTCYHNSVRMLSGVQYEAIQEALGAFFSEKAKSRGMKLEKSDYDGVLAVFVSSYSNYASFRNQTKDGVDDTFILSMIKDALYEKLQTEYGKGNVVILNVIEDVLKEAEIRIATKEFQQLKREGEKIKREKAPDKFVSCRAYEQKRYDEAELWITEGDSALGAVKRARSSEFQALFPIRGKSLNVLKANIQRILQNKEIREIFSLIGTGFDLNLKDEKTFNIKDLKFGKIIFATDADEDGYQIRVLLFLIFYKLAPELIRQGHIYIAETPRFKMELANGQVVYALNDEERDKILAENPVITINRFKGLGETDPDELAVTTVSPKTRHLIKLTCDFTNESERNMIDALFGTDKFRRRKTLITKYLGIEIDDFITDAALKMEQELTEEDEEEEEKNA
jgi:DNA gyrase subunit B